MVNTAHSFKLRLWLSRATLFGVVVASFGSLAIAQSPASLAATPYLPTTAPAATNVGQASTSPTGPTSPTSRYRGPPPVVMFRATPRVPPAIEPVEPPAAPPMAPWQSDTAQRRYSIANTAERDAANAGWNPANTEPVAAPPMVDSARADVLSRHSSAPAQARLYRGPARRILQDTGRSITRDLPEALADALPWVDRDAKNQSFDQVLDRVADELHRAAQADPAWALPAQREIRALAQRLDSLSAPPPLGQDASGSRPVSVAAGVDDRPFRPRPIWPGASGRPETQVRPVTLVTPNVQETGPRVDGVAARYLPALEDDDGMAPIVAPTSGRGSGARGVPKGRRPAASR